MTPKVISVDPLPGYKVLVTFDTSERKSFDVNPYISGDWFGKLKDLSFFSNVRPAGRTIEWADGQDIAPHELYELSVEI